MSEINKDLVKELLKDYKKPEDLIGKGGIRNIKPSQGSPSHRANQGIGWSHVH